VEVVLLLLERKHRQLRRTAQRILDRGDYHLVRDNDTEIIMHHLSRELAGDEKPDLSHGLPESPLATSMAPIASPSSTPMGT
jgi:hypothetical protein